MGIRGLVQALQPYRTLSTYPRNANDQDTEQVVIDGPSLAYHAYHVALARRADAGARNAFEAVPSCGDVVNIALKCLATIEEHGLRIAAVYFDGALPAGKISVRMERLQSYVRQIEKYKAEVSFTGRAPAMARSQGVTAEECFSSRPLATKMKALPALPFLVPAVIESLQGSEFANRTHVVPGEADCFCAAFAVKSPAIIITSDSDLLGYNLHDGSSVAFWREVELHQESHEGILVLHKYDMTEIAKRLEIEQSQALAYAVDSNPHSTFNSQIQSARACSNAQAGQYMHFKAQYTTEAANTWLSQEPSSVPIWLQRLDPRVSEWMHNSELAIAPTSISTPPDKQDLTMFMPVLIEDPNRASPWNVGTEIRALAYSIIVPSRQSTTSTSEVTRIGNRISERKIDHLSPSALKSAISAHLQVWDSIQTFTTKTTVLYWRLVAVHETCRYLLDEGKQLPSQTFIRNVLLGRRIPHDWDLIHFAAQVQAASYSLRMLKQHLCVYEAVREAHGELGEQDMPHEGILSLADRLRDLPSIEEWFDESPSADEDIATTLIARMLSLLGVVEKPLKTVEPSISGKKRKRKRKNEHPSVGAVVQPKIPANKFSLLADA